MDALAEPLISSMYESFPRSRTNGGISYINLSDEYIDWLVLANAGMLSRGNLLAFDYALRNLPSANPMIEIGVFAGLSTNVLSYYRRKLGVSVPFFNCDRWQFEGAGGNVGDSELSHEAYSAFVRDSYVRNVRTFSVEDLPYTIELFSDEFFAAWGEGQTRRDVFDRKATLGGPISFCYIDGDHSYEFARRDFVNTDRFLEVGGFVLFDDSADGTKFEVGGVIEEVKKMENYRVILKNPNYLFQKIG
jgi:hypothetical protein